MSFMALFPMVAEKRALEHKLSFSSHQKQGRRVIALQVAGDLHYWTEL